MKILDIHSASDFEKQFNVSRETSERLQCYSDLLVQWQKKINLVSTNTLHDIWQRHLADSAQLFSVIKTDLRDIGDGDKIFDLGSGAGFPGLVLAILAQDTVSFASGEVSIKFSLVEGAAKKCAFLREVARQTNASVEIVNKRIETLPQISNSIKTRLITARALAPLSQLFEYAQPVWSGSTKAYFLKGKDYDSEISDARKLWNFQLEKIGSLTSQDSVILQISALRRKEEGDYSGLINDRS